jgi:hypothetical protein
VTAHTWINSIQGKWYDGRVPTGLDMRTLDQSIFGALNGDGGGNGTPWTPSSPITIGGAGMWCMAPWTIAAAGLVTSGTAGGSTTQPGPQLVVGAVDAFGNIQINVVGPYGPGAYAPGDLVVVSGVAGTVEANGPWLTGLTGHGVTPPPGQAGVVLGGSTYVNAFKSSPFGLITALQPQFTFGDNDYFVLQPGHTAQSRVILTPVGVGLATPAVWSSNSVTSAGNAVYGLTSLLTGGGLDVPLRVHHQATLVSATLTFFVGQAHTSVPAILPGIRLVGMNMAGEAFPLATTSGSPGTDASGMQFFPTPASGAAWYDGGDVQTLTYTCDAGIVIDTTQYSYHAVIQDEFGVGALNGNIYVEIALTFADIADQHPQ